MNGPELSPFSGGLDVWRQPQMLFDERYAFDRPDRFGANLAVDLDWKIIWRLGLVGKFAWKSGGYLMAEPPAAGFYGYVGIALYSGSDGAPFRWTP